MRASAALAVVASVVAFALAQGAGAASTPKLIGVVGKNGAFKITLKNTRGKVVRTLAAGTYTIVVRDYSKFHNFELEREHRRMSRDITDVDFVGTKTLRVKLTRGEYKVYCDPHESSIFQNFTVR
jgi:plastocyanin